jgi:hypothetical protein
MVFLIGIVFLGLAAVGSVFGSASVNLDQSALIH